MREHAVGAIALLVCLSAHGQEYRDDWMGFKEGSWAKLYKKKWVNGAVYDWNLTERLKSASPDEAVMEYEVTVIGPGKKEEKKRSLKGLPGSTKNSGRTVGEEEVECDGKKYRCSVWEYRTEGVVIKTWESADEKVAGGALLLESTGTTDGVEEKTLRKAVKLGETIKVGERNLKCTVFEIESSSPKVVTKGKTWLCAEVPGLEVKTELSITAPGKAGENHLTVELREFERK